eukprot:c18751_g1_i1.p2 GENE.c18751_g1_i1~~c18751_g1_i1.p2  ORF type:complete len:137 (+),score=9.96 c18751_g1_i1:1-411(+)
MGVSHDIPMASAAWPTLSPVPESHQLTRENLFSDPDMGFLLRGVLTPAECEEMIEFAENRNMPHVSEASNGAIRKEYRDMFEIREAHEAFADEIYHRIRPFIIPIDVPDGRESCLARGGSFRIFVLCITLPAFSAI